MSDEFTKLQRYALSLIQTLLGVVSHNFRMVSINLQAERIVVRILLATHSDEDIEEIDDLVTEFEALLPGPVAIDVEVVVSEEPITLEPLSETSMVVFMRRE